MTEGGNQFTHKNPVILSPSKDDLPNRLTN